MVEKEETVKPQLQPNQEWDMEILKEAWRDQTFVYATF
jgi:hypothetical protein